MMSSRAAPHVISGANVVAVWRARQAGPQGRAEAVVFSSMQAEVWGGGGAAEAGGAVRRRWGGGLPRRIFLEDGCEGGDGGGGFEEGGGVVGGGGALLQVLEDGVEGLPDGGEEGLEAGGFGVGVAGAAGEELVGAACGGVFEGVDFEEEARGGGVGCGEDGGCVCEGCVGEGLGEGSVGCGEDKPAATR